MFYMEILDLSENCEVQHKALKNALFMNKAEKPDF